MTQTLDDSNDQLLHQPTTNQSSDLEKEHSTMQTKQNDVQRILSGKSASNASSDIQTPSFPQRLRKKKNDKGQFRHFLNVLKQLHINIPLVEALEQMPSYVKFLKAIMSKKKRIREYETVALTQECSAMENASSPK